MTNRVIFMILGEKGGVGKSLVGCSLIEHLRQQGTALNIFDFDRTCADVYATYKDCGAKLGIFSEAKKFQNYASPMFESALRGPVVVNTPAQCWNSLKQWLTINSVFEVAEANNIRFHYFFVTDGRPDSLVMLRNTATWFAGKAYLTVVKNHGVAKDEGRSSGWKLFNEDEALQASLQVSNATVIDFPAFYGEQELLLINQHKLRFYDAETYDKFGLLSRQRVVNFNRAVAQAFSTVDFGLKADTAGEQAIIQPK